MATYELIEHIEVDVARSTISFSSILTDGTYTDLFLKCSLRNTTNANYFTLKFNSSSANFTQKQLEGNGSVVNSSTRTDSIMRFAANTSNYTANTFASASISIPNYTSSNNKVFSVDTVTENDGTESYQCFLSCNWNQTSTISSIDLVSPSNFVQFSSASLYGVRKHNASTAPKATGGIISYDATNDYWVHTFTASGTFTPTQNLTCEYLVVAGGGGGGQGWNGGAGGGGGGGLLTGSNGVTASTNYTVTVGSGGANSANGTESSFLVTATGGGAGGPGPDARGTDGNSGGSGGGGSHGQLAADIGYGGTPTSGQGYAGGQSNSNGGDKWAGGGGGGAGAVGEDAPGVGDGGDGGAGLASSITGSSIYYAGGGGGNGGGSPSTDGVGGIGGGGDGGANGGTNGGAGQPATGGGGGGAGGAGGSGIVIVRYAA